MKRKYVIVILCLVAILIPLGVGGCKAKTTTTDNTSTMHVMTNLELTNNFTAYKGTVDTQGGAITALANRVGTLETSTNLTAVKADIATLQKLVANLNGVNASAINQIISDWFNTSVNSRITALENTGVKDYNLSYINSSVWELTHLPAVPPVITATLTTGATWSNSSYFVFCSAKDSVSSATLNYIWSASSNSLQVVPWLVDSQVLWYLPATANGSPISGTYTITCDVSDGIGGNTSVSTSITK